MSVEHATRDGRVGIGAQLAAVDAAMRDYRARTGTREALSVECLYGEVRSVGLASASVRRASGPSGAAGDHARRRRYAEAVASVVTRRRPAPTTDRERVQQWRAARQWR